MTNEERDNKLSEIHTAVMVMADKVEGHGETLYGNARLGLVKDVTLLQERQNQCPARKATTTEGKRLTITTVLLFIAVVVFLTNVAFAILTWIK